MIEYYSDAGPTYGVQLPKAIPVGSVMQKGPDRERLLIAIDEEHDCLEAAYEAAVSRMSEMEKLLVKLAVAVESPFSSSNSDALVKAMKAIGTFVREQRAK